MKRKLICSLSFILLCMLLSSCEYDSGNTHYINLEKPEPVMAGFNLANLNPEDTIYIYADTRLEYQLNTEGKELLNIIIRSEGIGFDVISNNSNLITIIPTATTVVTGKLKVEVSLKSGSGSIADKRGMETYLGEFTYNLKFIPRIES